MRLTLMLLLVVPGLLLLATPGLPLGLCMVWAGWWVYERSRLPNGDGLVTLLMTIAGIGGLIVVAQATLQWLARTLP